MEGSACCCAAGPDLRDIAGQTALMNACSWVELVRLMLEHGGCDAAPRQGVLQWACSRPRSPAATAGAAGKAPMDKVESTPPHVYADEPLEAVASARVLIDECLAATNNEARALMREEVKPQFFDDFLRQMPIPTASWRRPAREWAIARRRS